MDWKNSRIDAFLERALIEDKAAADTTTHLTIDSGLRASASIVARQEMVVCGLGAVPRFFEIFARLDKHATAQTRFEVVSHPEIFDGVRVRENQVLAVIRHNARALLSCERVILNLLQHMSGVATQTRRFVDAIQGTHAHVLDTRKTIPG
ncbi:MAG: nicotinate-nucleotide diphosphorylase, partial [Terracidiphilus sp.]